MSDVYATAKTLLSKGIMPIPTVGKKPIVDWRNVTVTPDMVDQWHAEKRWQGNIAVICGERSGNLVIIDFDGPEGYEAFKAQFPDMLDTYTVKTGSGNGYHLYYKVDLLPANTFAKNVPALNNAHIEIRAQDILTIIPPSIHPDTGKPYVIINTNKAKQLTDMVAIVKWVEALDPKPRREFPATIAHDSNLNPKVLTVLRDHFINAPGAKPSGEWINCHCPDPAHKDENISFGYHAGWGVGHCFGCSGVFNTKRLCELTNTDYKALGGLFEPSSEPVNTNGQLSRPPSSNGSQPQDDSFITAVEAPEPPLIFMTGAEAQKALDSEMDGMTIAKHPPLPMPLYFLRRHGIRVLTPGRLCYFASISGGGKTQMMELIADRLLMAGRDVIIRSDEWISRDTYAQDMVMRRIQRHGGPTYQQMALHKLWESEEVLHMKWQADHSQGMNIPRDKREGVQFTPHQYNLYQRVRDRVTQWPGEMYYLLEQGVSVEKMIIQVEATYARAIQLGRKPVAFFLDYAQLVWLEQETNGKLWIEESMTKVKDMCGRLGMVGFVFSQLNQDATERVNKGEDFSPTWMNWLSERQANLVVMWAALKDTEGKYLIEDKEIANPCTGALANTPMRTIQYQIVKNSFGEPNAKGLLDWNAVSLRIEDARETLNYEQKPMEV